MYLPLSLGTISDMLSSGRDMRAAAAASLLRHASPISRGRGRRIYFRASLGLKPLLHSAAAAAAGPPRTTTAPPRGRDGRSGQAGDFAPCHDAARLVSGRLTSQVATWLARFSHHFPVADTSFQGRSRAFFASFATRHRYHHLPTPSHRPCRGVGAAADRPSRRARRISSAQPRRGSPDGVAWPFFGIGGRSLPPACRKILPRLHATATYNFRGRCVPRLAAGRSRFAAFAAPRVACRKSMIFDSVLRHNIGQGSANICAHGRCKSHDRLLISRGDFFTRPIFYHHYAAAYKYLPFPRAIFKTSMSRAPPGAARPPARAARRGTARMMDIDAHYI